MEALKDDREALPDKDGHFIGFATPKKWNLIYYPSLLLAYLRIFKVAMDGHLGFRGHDGSESIKKCVSLNV